MEQVIRTHKLDVGYDGKSVIKDVDILGMKGELICLLGPNGAGKSTILRTLSGLLAPVEGAVFIHDEPLPKKKKADLAKVLSLVLTDKTAPQLTTVQDIVAMGRMPYTDFMGRLTKKDWQKVDEALITVGAKHLSKRYITSLSDGEKQKVMIARALVQEPELIILDEPTSHLDIKHKVEVIKLLQKLTNEKKITCILSLHDIDLALKGCEKVILVNNGQIVCQGTPEQIIKHNIINELYQIQGARYNELLGAVELQNDNKPSVLIVSGNGTGMPIFRTLNRKGIGMVAGVLHENDIDTQIILAMGQPVIIEKPFEPISTLKKEQAMAAIEMVENVIDTGFQVGSGNKANLEIIAKAIAMEKQVYTLRSKEECEKLWGILAASCIYCENVKQLEEHILQNTTK